MVDSLLTRIESLMPKLSKGQKLIANYIQTEYGKAAFMTAARLGETVGVSESTVVRFATELGYSGYPKMQQAMQEMIRDKLTSLQRIEVSQSRIGSGSVIEHVLSSDIDNIKQTIEETSHEDFKKSVKAISEAKTIYICASQLISLRQLFGLLSKPDFRKCKGSFHCRQGKNLRGV